MTSSASLMHIRKKVGGKVGKKAVPLCLALSPTRELAQQIADVLSEAGAPCGIKSVCLYGGTKKEPQISALKSGVNKEKHSGGSLMLVEAYPGLGTTEFAELQLHNQIKYVVAILSTSRFLESCDLPSCTSDSVVDGPLSVEIVEEKLRELATSCIQECQGNQLTILNG